MRPVALAVAVLPLLACTRDDATTIAKVAPPTGLIVAGDRAFVTTDDGTLYIEPLAGGTATQISTTGTGVAALAPDGVTLVYADAAEGIIELDTRTATSRLVVGHHGGVQAMAATARDLYWIDRDASQAQLRALDRATGAVRVVDPALQFAEARGRVDLVADEAAVYVHANTSLVRYDRATGEARELATSLGPANGLAIDGGDLYVVQRGAVVRIAIADGSRHVLGGPQASDTFVVGATADVVNMVATGGAVYIAEYEWKEGGLGSSYIGPSGRIVEADDTGIAELESRPTSEIVGLGATSDRVVFAERPSSGGGALLAISR